MFRILCAFLLTLCFTALLGSAGGQEQETSKGAIKGWGSPIDSNHDCAIREDNGKVSIKVPAGLHDLWKGQKDETKRFNAPRVMREIEGDFVVRVKVTTTSQPGADLSEIPALRKLTGLDGTHPYQGVGLLVWDSDGHYLRVERNVIVHPKGVTLTVPWYVQGGKRVNDVKISQEVIFKGRSTWLRLARSGQKLKTSISHDGKDWLEMGVLTTEFPTKVQVGVAAVNVSNHELVAEFEDFNILKQ